MLVSLILNSVLVYVCYQVEIPAEKEKKIDHAVDKSAFLLKKKKRVYT